MPPSKRGGKNPLSQAEKELREQVKALRKRQKDLLKNAGKDLRSFRHEVAVLKKAGVVAKYKDVRRQAPTRYMLRKVKNFADVIRGDVIPVRAKKEVREKYKEKGMFEERGPFIIVPREEAKQRVKIRKGMVTSYRPLRMGEERKVFLPYKVGDLEALAVALRDDPTLNGLKEPDEQFAFRLFKHNSHIGFVDSEELADYIEKNYRRLFGNHIAFENFVLMRFKNSAGHLVGEYPEEERYYDRPRKKRKQTPKRDFIAKQRRERDAERKAQERANETPEQKRRRLDKQKTITARNRQRKFLGD